MEAVLIHRQQASEENDSDDDGDEAAHEDDWDEQHEANVALKDVLESLMECNPTVFAKNALPLVGTLMKTLLATKDPKFKHNDQLLAFFLAASALSTLKENSYPLWEIFMEKVLGAVHDNSAEFRETAAYIINLAARVAHFGVVARTAHDKIMIVLQGQKKFAKKKDDMHKMAADNMTAALLQLLIYHDLPSSSWETLLNHLPLRTDTLEGEKAHADVLRLLKEQHRGLLGPEQKYTAKVLGVLAEVYGSEGSNDELNRDLHSTFLQIPEHVLRSLQSQFSEKQKKKINRVLKGSGS